jgi:hypothetical protein
MTTHKKSQIATKTYTECRYNEIEPNPLNPRRIFDKYKLDVLEESIRDKKILVPLMAYRGEDGELYILDGERRWRCAERIEKGEVSVHLRALPSDVKIPSHLKEVLDYNEATGVLTHRAPINAERHDELQALSRASDWQEAVAELYSQSKKKPPKEVVIPANIVDPPTPEANMLYMFHVHNLRDQWELMPTALSLQIIVKELGETDDAKLAELTKLSEPNVKRCKILLTFPKRYQEMMLHPNPDERLKANLFIEMHPVLDFYEGLGTRACGGRSRHELVDLFIQKYRDGLIPSVIHFRKILNARDLLEGTDRWDEVKNAATRFVAEPKSKIKTLFDPLTAEEQQARNVTELCKGFVGSLQKLKLEHTTKRRGVVAALQVVQKEVQKLLNSLAGEE